MDHSICAIPQNPSCVGDIQSFIPGTTLDFQDGQPSRSNLVRWLDCGDFYISDRVLLSCISWDDLNDLGFIGGKTYTLDGRSCCIRVPTNDEWDKAIQCSFEMDEILHWSGMLSWTTSGKRDRDLVPCRGYSEAAALRWSNPELRYTFVGFRPLLEVKT